MAVAEASFNTCIDSISFGLTKSMSFTIIPSTTNSGSELFMVPIPRILIVTPAPGAPELELTSTPATWPCKA